MRNLNARLLLKGLGSALLGVAAWSTPAKVEATCDCQAADRCYSAGDGFCQVETHTYKECTNVGGHYQFVNLGSCDGGSGGEGT
jgi:hypothetical protein